MKLNDIKNQAAYLALNDRERQEVDALLGDTLLVDVAALDHIDGDPKSLTATDLRAWLKAAKTQPYALIGVEAASPEAKRVFEALMKELDPKYKLGAGGMNTIMQTKSLAALLGVAEQGRVQQGFVLEELLAGIEHQAEALARTTKPGPSLLKALGNAKLSELSKEIQDYRKRTSGLKSWLADATATLQTAVKNVRHGLLKVVTGAPDHEGHFDGTHWRNWTDNYSVAPKRFVKPNTEAAISEAVVSSKKVRVVGGGHSFNDSPLTPGTLISLDAYNRVLEIDPKERTAKVQGGLRLRDLNKLLEAKGLALPVLGSTDAQSIAGLVSTDLHGTGRDKGFLSEQIRSLRIIDAQGVGHTVKPGDDLFHAAIGGLGTVGVITEVELNLEPAFRLKKTLRMVDRTCAEGNIEKILAEHEHVSFYYGAGGDDATQAVRMHTWDKTAQTPDEDWENKMAVTELTDFALSGFATPVIEEVAESKANSMLVELLSPEKSVVAPSSRAFGRRLFYRHDEIEFGLPFEKYRAALSEIMALLKKREYFSVVEVRFTPDTSRGLMGPGVGRRTAYIELATPMSQPTAEVYAEVEAIFLKYGGQPHLGKKTNMTSDDMLKAYGDRFLKMKEVQKQQDATGKFMNRFTEQVF